MGFGVKNTTLIRPLDLLCPHFCRGCGRLGEILCECCKNDILESSKLDVRQRMTANMMSVGWREGLLGELVEAYKYDPVRAMGGALAELLAEVIPSYREEVVVVPLPTIARHIRERGFDHMWLIAKRLARLKSWQCERLLVRTKDTVQVGANRTERLSQAEGAYEMRRGVRLEAGKVYLLVDDVWTTGASMRAAKKVLHEAGAKKIRLAVIATSR